MQLSEEMSRSIWRNPVHFLAFGFGSGTLPYMPGTWGTLAAVPLYLLMQDFSWIFYVIMVIAFIVFGVWCCGVAAEHAGVHDHPGIVWDEIVGYLVTMFGAPHGVFWIILGFILFRIFDITKPFPIRWIDSHLRGGAGIVFDDVMAAIYAWIALQLIAVLIIR